MNRFYLFLFSLVIFFCTTGYADEKEPEWLNNPPDGIYVGISQLMASEQEARVDAIKDGKKQIIATLGGLIETEFIDHIIEGSESPGSSFTDSKVKIVAKNILSVKAKDVFIKQIVKKEGLLKKKTFYQAYAAIEFSEAEHERFLDELIDETIQVTENRIGKVNENIDKGSVIFALSELKKIPSEYENLLEITGLSPTQIGKMKNIDQKVQSYIHEIQNNIFISSEKQKFFTKLHRPLSEVPTVFVYLEINNKKIPLKAVDVKFEAITGKIDFNSTGKTNDMGIASCKINEVCCNDKVILRATVIFPEESRIEPLIYNFYLVPDNIISIKVFENNIDETVADSYLENLLIQKFTEMEFQVVDNDFLKSINATQVDRLNAAAIARQMENSKSDFLVFGNVIVDRTNKMRETLCFAWAKAAIKIYDVQQMEIIESIILEEKGAGNSEHAAGVDAIKKASEVVTQQLTEKIINKGSNNKDE